MFKHLAVGATLCTLLASTAMADGRLNVYDSHGKLVGPLYGVDQNGDTIVVLTFNGFKNFVALGQEGYSVNAELYFGGPNCESPTPFVAFDRYQTLIPEAVFDGTTLYYLNPNQDANLAVQSRIVDGKCENLPDNLTIHQFLVMTD